jgi:penicillin-binding protein 2
MGRRIGDDASGGGLDPQQGDTLHTSLDFLLQQYIADNFPAGKLGAVMAMDPRDGEILAMYSSPSFDPNAFIGGIDQDLWNSWLASEDTPLLNRAVQGIYPPASPWKLVIALMALERGEVDIDTEMPVPCTGGYQYGNRYFRCWKPTGHGHLNLAEAIQQSCDVFFYQLGLKLGLDSILLQAGQWGLRDKTGVDLPGEVSPVFPASTKYFDELYGPQGWTNAVTLNIAIGQGENSQTLISMMRFYSLFARGDGAVPVPRFVKDGEPPDRGTMLATPDNVLRLRNALEMVVESGTAVRSRVANLRIAGKTGTAQNSHGPNHGWFVGFAPVQAPEIVVGAIVEFGEHGSSVAPFVNRVIARHLLGPDSELDRPVRWILPSDSAPVSMPVPGDTSRIGTAAADAAARTR